MQEVLVVLGIAGAVCVGAMSPGPSFLLVARTAVARSRADGLSAALGMGVGSLAFAGAALLGLQTLFVTVPEIYLAIKLLGGCYLIYLGVRLWLGAGQRLFDEQPCGHAMAHRPLRSFLVALGTQCSNPKAAVIYTGIFAAFVPQHVTPRLALAIAFVVLVIESAWYTIVALALSAARPRAAYLRYKRWLDRGAGGILTLLGLRLVRSARQI